MTLSCKGLPGQNNLAFLPVGKLRRKLTVVNTTTKGHIHNTSFSL
jgi:hypothetical protein